MPDGAIPLEQQAPLNQAGRDPLIDLLNRLNRDAATVAAQDSDLSRRVAQLATAAEKPERLQNATFRTRVAYVLQDMEKLGGPISTVPADLRAEMTRLAATAPGLQNEHIKALAGSTASLNDVKLIREIRQFAHDTGTLAQGQDAPEIQARAADLDKRIRQAPDTPNAVKVAQSPAATDRPGEPQGAPDAVRRDGAEQAAARGMAQADREPQQVSAAAAVLGMALGALTRHEAAQNPAMERQPTSIADRMKRHQAGLAQQRDEATLQGAEQSQRAAMEAIQAFRSSPASSVLTKINDAAKADPGGMTAVLSEMREGGRYGDLRSQFNSALTAERGTRAAYDRMNAMIGRYGTDREAAEAIGVKNNTTATLAARFEKMDAEIGKATSMLPSREEGKSKFDELGDVIKKIVDQAVATLKAVASPGTGARASSGPSPI